MKILAMIHCIETQIDRKKQEQEKGNINLYYNTYLTKQN